MDRNTVVNDWAIAAGWSPTKLVIDVDDTVSETTGTPDPMDIWIGSEQTLYAFALIAMKWGANNPEAVLKLLLEDVNDANAT